MVRPPISIPPALNATGPGDPEAWDCPTSIPSVFSNIQSSPLCGLRRNWRPMGKHVAKEALCSAATHWVLDEFPAA